MNFFRGRYSLSVAIGAIFGALSRFYIAKLVESLFGQEWQFLGTFFVNLSGCLIIAYIFTMIRENIRIIAPELGLMIATGFCGSYTTFSTYSLEVNKFLEQGNLTFGLIYWLGSVLGGMMALKIGVILARTGFPR
ncbi:MAG: fluoride efflux transporter CrcB [Microcystis sp.]|jgi:CrcB protein|uniref:Fluoride-specific ion channel FluC n=1 Tax=Microcystis flos-aquae Mf_QC_C_20070823_S10D TaxID=2486236 RepID=A0A552KXF1_9CHRO|nr:MULTISPECIES: fluoride efflux transporter CrcB [unclassified Microcystis]MCA2818775.1 fluoride efflux transporter CrcB [Microcystis sp. M085S1]MCA2856197.1 fluoride efflux transporter CrcB [Microcystis sp. M065S1]MCZ8053813.1 fluoride efflux transporter CrcB [Microcystis sp. LE19-12.2C]MDJ0551387.1 fluoride efflux transporter CrcB [Microcystis sp. M49637_WE12]TRT80285.1 MAG: fluoride efflux transporter CrcB [Microcystis flos-aquae Ma_QC_C_20070823_S18]TRU02825.1 MAG: fluoride efflux transp